MKIGKWNITKTGNRIKVDDGWVSEYPVWHGWKGVAVYDFPERIPKAVKAAVVRMYKAMEKVTNPKSTIPCKVVTNGKGGYRVFVDAKYAKHVDVSRVHNRRSR